MIKKIAALLLVLSPYLFAQEAPQKAPKRINYISPLLEFQTRGLKKPKDMCVWVYPDPEKGGLSTVIVTDPLSDKVAVLDLKGNIIQLLPDLKADGVDVRYNFPLGDKKVDIVAFVNRDRRRSPGRLIVMTVDPQTRQLTRIDDNKIMLPKVYGGCLYRSPTTEKFYYNTTSRSGNIEVLELVDNGQGRIGAVRDVRKHRILGLCRTAVADDENNRLFICERKRGIWLYDADPKSDVKGKLFAKAGEDGLVADIEGMALYKFPKGEGYLVVLSEGNDRLVVFDRKSLRLIGSFGGRNIIRPEGIDITNRSLDRRFSRGMMVCNAIQPNGSYHVFGFSWEDVARAFDPKLKLSTQWDPRVVEDLSKRKRSKRK